MESDFGLICWQEEHTAVIWTVALPITIVWIIGFPLGMFVILYKRRRFLDSKDMLIKYGLFYIGLTE